MPEMCLCGLFVALIPAAKTRFQRSHGIDDSADDFCSDILNSNDHQSDAVLTRMISELSGTVVEWLADQVGHLFSFFESRGH